MGACGQPPGLGPLCIFSCICPYGSSQPPLLWALSLDLCPLRLALSPFIPAELILILSLLAPGILSISLELPPHLAPVPLPL